MSRTFSSKLFALVLATAIAGPAYAQDEGEGMPGDAPAEGMPEEGQPPADAPPADNMAPAEPAPADAAPAEAMTAEGPPPLTLPAGSFQIDGMLEMNLSKSAAFKPFSIAPDIYYGVMDQLTVGLIHSGLGQSGFYGGTGNGICVTGADNGCAKAYNNIGLQGAYSLLSDGPLHLAGQVGVFFQSFSPELFLAFKVGVMARYMMGPLLVLFNPNVFIGATKRDLGNKEQLNLPLLLGFMAMQNLIVGIQTGLSAPFSHFGDLWVLPLSVGGQYWINQQMGLTLAFTFGALAGGDAVPTGADMRSINLAFTYKH